MRATLSRVLEVAFTCPASGEPMRLGEIPRDLALIAVAIVILPVTIALLAGAVL